MRTDPASCLLSLIASTKYRLAWLQQALGWLHVENFADFVADHLRLGAAAAALALIRHAGNDLLHAGKIGGQPLPARMLTPLLLLILRRRGQRLAFALGSHFNVADPGFEIQQPQLKIAQLLAAGAVLGNSLLAQPLFKNLHLQLRMLQLVLIRVEFAAHRGKHRRLQMCFQLFKKVGAGRCAIGRSGRCARMEIRSHEAY
jgi:hypothetical protein